MESFFASLKKELLHGADFATRAEARVALVEYIAVFYNNQRRHSSLGYICPAECEQTEHSKLTVHFSWGTPLGEYAVPIAAPYRRNVRQFIDGQYSEGGRWMYILHDRYAQSPEHYIRGYLVLQNDLMKLFESVEPAHQNLNTYSFRIHEILMRAAIEVEANCKAILTENGYAGHGHWNVGDYMKVNASHHLSSYEVKLPVWNGAGNVRTPFAEWAAGDPLPWYQAYNRTKHDRHNRFHEATLQHALDAVCGLVVLLASQFQNHDFAPSEWAIAGGGPNDGMESTIGGYFRVRYPNDFPDADRYDFNWPALQGLVDPFQNYAYPP